MREVKKLFKQWWNKSILKRAIQTRGLQVAFFVASVLFLLNGLGVIHFSQHEVGWRSVGKIFFEHFWLELISGIAIWLLLESQFDKYGKMPRDTRKRKYKAIALNIASSKRDVRILDNEINSFFVKIRDFENVLRKCLENLHDGRNIQILLLHPGSSAAKQRRNDLFNISVENSEFFFDFYEEMREGIKKIHSTIEKLNSLSKGNKIEVKLFNATHSLIFTAWDDNVIFSLMPPNKASYDSRSFGTEKNTPLAEYFNEHFDDLWRNEKNTIDINDYQYLRIVNPNGMIETIADNKTEKSVLFYWGADSSDHNLPRFICTKMDGEHKTIQAIARDKAAIQILHNNELRWAQIHEIEQRNVASSGETLYSFAKNQIEKTNNVHVGQKQVFKIKYLHHHRINLKDGNYVQKHLEERGYCHVPSNMFEVYIGMRIRDMLISLYDFFGDFNSYYSTYDLINPQNNYGKAKRIILEFTCLVEKSDIVIFPNMNSTGNFCSSNLTIPESKATQFNSFVKFIESTIKSDIDHILGKYGKGNAKAEGQIFRNSIEKFTVKIHLLQIVVNEKSTAVNPQGDCNDSEYYKENEGKYTVLHMAGKKNILGGISMISYDGHVAEYNLTSPIEAIYLTKERIIEDSKGKQKK